MFRYILLQIRKLVQIRLGVIVSKYEAEPNTFKHMSKRRKHQV